MKWAALVNQIHFVMALKCHLLRSSLSKNCQQKAEIWHCGNALKKYFSAICAQQLQF